MSTDHFNTTLELLQDRFPDYISYVPDVFFDDPPVSRWLMSLMAVLFLILMVLSISGNALMVICYAKYPDVQSSSNKLVINLAVADSIMHLKGSILIINGFYGGPILGGIGCIMFASFGAASGVSSIWTITAITCERCMAISSPRNANMRRFPGKTVNLTIMGIWMLALGFSCSPMIGIGRYVSEPYLLSCTSFDVWNSDKSNLIYMMSFHITAWLIPLITITRCYSKLSDCMMETCMLLAGIMTYTRTTKALIRQATASDFYEQSSVSNADLNPEPSVAEKKTVMYREAERRTEKILAYKLLVIIFVWIITWTPFAMITVLQFFGLSHYINNVVALVAMLMCKSSSVINSYLYGFRLPKFRKHIRQLLSWLPCIKKITPVNIRRRRMQCSTSHIDVTNRSGEMAIEGHSDTLKHMDLSKANSSVNESDHARVEFKAECHQNEFQLQELHCPKNEELVEERPKAVCVKGTQNQLHFRTEPLCATTLREMFKRRISA